MQNRSLLSAISLILMVSACGPSMTKDEMETAVKEQADSLSAENIIQVLGSPAYNNSDGIIRTLRYEAKDGTLQFTCIASAECMRSFSAPY